MLSVKNELCLSLRIIFTAVANSSMENRLGISQKLKKVNSIKPDDAFFHFAGLKIFFCTEKLKIDGIMQM